MGNRKQAARAGATQGIPQVETGAVLVLRGNQFSGDENADDWLAPRQYKDVFSLVPRW